MPDFLTFALAAPLAAMGEIAVGERRGSWDRPGRSAVLGLIAAVLGSPAKMKRRTPPSKLDMALPCGSSTSDLCCQITTPRKFRQHAGAGGLLRGPRS